MDQKPVEREQILEALQVALEPLEPVLGLFEAGSAAFGRVDRWSDIDLGVLIEDDSVAEVFAVAESALESLSPVELRWVIPSPTWHGHAQRFYRLRDAGRFLLVDLTLMRRSDPNWFLEPEQHGQALVLFDKAGLLVPPPFDAEKWRARMRADLSSLRASMPMFESFVEKELLRGNLLDALSFYMGQTLRPLITVLGMRFRPLRYHFGPRYLRLDLPPELYQELTELYQVRDAADLQAKQQRAHALFHQTAAELDLDALPLESLSAEARAPHLPPG